MCTSFRREIRAEWASLADEEEEEEAAAAILVRKKSRSWVLRWVLPDEG